MNDIEVIKNYNGSIILSNVGIIDFIKSLIRRLDERSPLPNPIYTFIILVLIYIAYLKKEHSVI